MERWRRYILDESAYKDIIADTPRGVSEEKWKELVDYMREKDPSGKSKYLRWFARNMWSIMIPYNTDALPQKYTDERADELNYKKLDDYSKILQRYHILLPYIKASPENKRYADIGAVMGLGHLRNLANEFEAVKNKKDALKKAKMDDAELAKAETDIIRETDKYIIRRPHTTLACQRYSKGAPWCIGADRNNQFLGYMDEGMVPYILEFTYDEIPHGHFLRKVAILTHYDYYDPDLTIVDDQVYDANNETLSIEGFRDMIEDIISEDELEHIMKELKMDTILHPPIEGGVGSDIGEKFKGDAEWEPNTANLEDIMKHGYDREQDVEEGRDYQKESERIKDHPRLKKQVLDKGANKDTGGGKGHIKLSFKRGPSAPPG